MYNLRFKVFQQCSHCIQIDNEECDSDENEFTQFNFGYDPTIQARFQLRLVVRHLVPTLEPSEK